MVISVVNKKGGTGKTTSAINIGRCLALAGKKVLLIDLDPQSNLSFSLGIKVDECYLGEAIVDREIKEEYLFQREQMDVLPSTGDLINYEVEFIRRDYPYTVVKETLESVSSKYDYVLVDCPPSVSFLTVNSLIASDGVLIPMQMDVLSLQGLNQILLTVDEIRENYNPKLVVIGVLGVLVDGRRQLTYEILEHIRNNYGVNIFNNYIRQNVRAAEAPSHGISVIEYAPSSNSAMDYKRATDELLLITK